MDEPTQKAWELYRSAFKDGEQVVLETWYGRLLWGKLKSTNDGVVLTRPDGTSSVVSFGHVVFMAHDGFPVKRIMGMSATEAERIAAVTPTEQIRQCMVDWNIIKDPPVYIGGGCPFVYGPFRVEAIHNKGNSGRAFWDHPEEEVLVLRSRDGAVMHSYDMDHLFFPR